MFGYLPQLPYCRYLWYLSLLWCEPNNMCFKVSLSQRHDWHPGEQTKLQWFGSSEHNCPHTLSYAGSSRRPDLRITQQQAKKTCLEGGNELKNGNSRIIPSQWSWKPMQYLLGIIYQWKGCQVNLWPHLPQSLHSLMGGNETNLSSL